MRWGFRPVWLTHRKRAGPLTNMRGPGISPSLMASRKATSLKASAPTLRTVVKPASMVLRANVVASSACSAGWRINP